MIKSSHIIKTFLSKPLLFLVKLTKLYPTLRMDVKSLHILCKTGLKSMRCSQVTGKYARDYKKAQSKCLRACRGVA